MYRFLVVIFATFCISLHGLCGSVRLSVEPARGKRNIENGAVFYLNIEVKDIDGRPEIPQTIPGGKVMYFDHTGQSSSMTSINGRVSQTMSNTWVATVRANKEGEFTFGPISVAGVRSNQVHYVIGRETQAAQTSSSQQSASGRDGASDKPKFIGKGDGNLFMRASISEGKIYEQQALVYTVKLYTTYDAIKFIGATSAPKFDGFVIEESKDVSKSLSFETYNGKSYATAVIAKYIIFPQMTGNLKIAGNTYTVSVDQREYYQDPFWGSMSVSSPLQLNVTPNDLSVNVMPLPAPKPADFSGGVGNFAITANLKQKEFKTNQAASIVYTVTGSGNLKYVQLPDLESKFPSELEVYTPSTNVKTEVGSSSVSGTATFTYSFIPLEEGRFTIPAVKLVYFNPQKGEYQTSETQEFTINVGKGAASSKSQTSERLRFMPDLKKIDSNSLSLTHTPWIYQFGYWVWFIAPFAIFMVLVLMYRRYVKEHSDLAAFNMKRANKLANKRLKRALGYLRQGNKDLFYDELLTALWGYLSYKLNMPTSELSRDNIRQVLLDKNIPQNDIERMIDIIDKAEYAKYSPDPDGAEMHKSYSESFEIINAMERSFKSKI